MLHYDDLPFIEELTIDELLRTLPEIRQSVRPHPRDEDVSLFSLLEQPEALPNARWRSASTKNRRRPRPAGPVFRAA